MNDVGVETKTGQKSVKIKMEEEVVEEVAAAVAPAADEGGGGAGAGRDEEDPKENASEQAEDTERANLDSLMWKSRGGDYTFHPDPFKYSVWPLLFLRLVERTSFYSYNLINPGFLTGKH